jgi:subtilase family protein
MRPILRTAAPPLALAFLLFAAAPHASCDGDTLEQRYADFQTWQNRRWQLDPHGRSSNRPVHYRGESGSSGSTDSQTLPVFDGDFLARRSQLDGQIGVTDAHGAATGAGVVVAVLDGGFNLDHPWIADQILPYGYDPVGQDWDPEDLGNDVDDDGDGIPDGGVGHGTFVCGMILEVAPDVSIIPVRIADDEGHGTDEELAAGIAYAISMGVDVINISYDVATLSSLVSNKLDLAYQNGITVVVSVGNDGGSTVSALATAGHTIGVGSVDDDDVIAGFSNTPSAGNGLVLFAPGVDLYGPHGGPSDSACCLWSGTSFSAALVSGAAALALDLDGTLTPNGVRDALEDASTTTVHTRSGGTYSYAGRLDLRDLTGQ